MLLVSDVSNQNSAWSDKIFLQLKCQQICYSIFKEKLDYEKVNFGKNNTFG